MEGGARNIREGPTLWAIPFTILMIILIVAAADTLFPFLPLNIGQRAWMWAVSTLVTTIIASLVTEFISLNSRRALLSMALAATVSTVIYVELFNFIQWPVVDAILSVVPNPLLGSAVYAIVLTLVPGALTGVVLGGVLGFFPSLPRIGHGAPDWRAASSPIEGRWTGFEKACERCGHTAPFESKFCPFCGVELMRRHAPPVRFCRFCGARIYLLGQFCPECGMEINMLSKPSVYISQ
ncbi:hypothetical protein AC482_07155 [miscellaneous Crenarchaeota group-15 archaeon DG-45]|uniref:DZANK-type domain-containing protein n=1 Tax=miscellaneous Crenarchaeota group-15 archaeon DG-45 TaxID=1685127 RepID=A0A0M0BLC6_9ARCH|nr:MAG: hypothetical protein AC482_07155 [miscellaneous Crenarchaeota group-15 archaeon DG-45]